MSWKLALVAGLGPALLITRVKVIVPPALGVDVPAVLSRLRSATRAGVTETVLSRGRVVIENGALQAKPGSGRFLRRQPRTL